jgi:type IV pilus assembly protein PilB
MPQFDDKRIADRVSDLRQKEAEALVQTMASQRGIQYVDLHGITIDVEALRLIPEEAAREAEMAVFLRQNKTLSVAIRNPESPRVRDALKALESDGYTILSFMVSRPSLEYAWERYADTRYTVAEKRGILDVDPDAIGALAKEIQTPLDVQTKVLEIQAARSAEKVSHTIETIFGGALALSASDIHIEPEKHDIRLRYRIDGVLWDITDLEKAIYQQLNSRLKLLSGLILNVTAEAQDGRFTFQIGERALEVRTSVIPGAYGESIVMRLLDPSAFSFQLENLGLNEPLLRAMQEELARPNGAIITTGPTGSGKTTALYAFLQKVHTADEKIVTIEDPVEYRLEGIVQTQVEDDYSFADGLRAILRQDPDIIMVGEIRDREVAETAVHAALTGHLVFSTLHTNSAAGAFPRLLDLGVDPRVIGSAFNVMLGQRLVRMLCEHCKETREATTEEQALMTRIMGGPVDTTTLYDGRGCDACGGSGFKGRIGIFEAIRIDKEVEQAVISDPREENIIRVSRPQGIPTMQQDGILKVLKGVTSFDELARVVDLYNTRVIDVAVDDAGSADGETPAA